MLFDREEEFNAEILRASVDSGVKICVLKGFFALESAFNPKAYRYEQHIKDASYGLAQILAGTARGVGFTGKDEDLFEPYQSAVFGGKFIRRLADRYPRLPDLVAAYNMGRPRKIGETTPLIANIYRYPIGYREQPPAGWIYANEIYVRRVCAYIAYYQAKEAGETQRAEYIEALLKQKMLSAVYFLTMPYQPEVKI